MQPLFLQLRYSRRAKLTAVILLFNFIKQKIQAIMGAQPMGVQQPGSYFMPTMQIQQPNQFMPRPGTTMIRATPRWPGAANPNQVYFYT